MHNSSLYILCPFYCIYFMQLNNLSHFGIFSQFNEVDFVWKELTNVLIFSTFLFYSSWHFWSQSLKQQKYSLKSYQLPSIKSITRKWNKNSFSLTRGDICEKKRFSRCLLEVGKLATNDPFTLIANFCHLLRYPKEVLVFLYMSNIYVSQGKKANSFGHFAVLNKILQRCRFSSV